MSDPVDTITLRLGDLVTQPPPVEAAADNDASTEKTATPGNADASGLFENKYTVQVKLADQQADPNSPLFSVKSFEELKLPPELLKGLYAMKYAKPSKIQERALPLLLHESRRNMIGQSQSGTGKTAAFVLAMLSRIDVHIKEPQAICLAPSRELARQIHDVAKAMAEFTKITIRSIQPDQSQIRKKDTTVYKDQVIIGTPGSVLNKIKYKNLPVGMVKIFVLDEADNMLELDGLGDQSTRIKNALKNSHPQIVLFSATFPEHVREFASSFAPNANEITLKQEELNVTAIKQFFVDCESGKKYETLIELYSIMNAGQSIVFCARRDSAQEVAQSLEKEGYSTRVLHGKMLPEDRDKAMDDFRRGVFKHLITTNVLARGIDIPQVALVINYDIPMDQRGQVDSEAYLHRIGRTGRFGRTGVSVIIVDDKKSWEQMREIEAHFQIAIQLLELDDLEATEKKIKKIIENTE